MTGLPTPGQNSAALNFFLIKKWKQHSKTFGLHECHLGNQFYYLQCEDNQHCPWLPPSVAVQIKGKWNSSPLKTAGNIHLEEAVTAPSMPHRCLYCSLACKVLKGKVCTMPATFRGTTTVPATQFHTVACWTQDS